MKQTWLGMGELPHPQRTAAVAMVLLQCAALAEMMQATVFATLAAAIALGGWLAAQHGLVRTFHRSRWLVFLLLAFACKYALSPQEFPFELAFINTPLSYEAACFFVVLQLSVLFARQYEEKLPLWFPGAASAALVFTADVRATSWTRTLMLIIVAVHCIMVAWFSAASRRRVPAGGRPWHWLRGLASISCLAVAVFVGSTGSILIHRYEQELESALARLVAAADAIPSHSGSSDSGGLHDITDQQVREGTRIALRVVSESPPGYLRGRAFDRFEHDRWLVSISPHPAMKLPRENLPATPRLQDSAFRVSTAPGPFQVVDIWPDESESSRALFLPQSTAIVFTNATSVDVDLALTALRSPVSNSSPYSAAVGTEDGVAPLPNGPLPVYLLAPNDLDGRVPLLAAALTYGTHSVQEKVERIESFFHSKFKYKIVHRGRRAPGESALPEFLFKDQAGHCEYFATASVLLLRLAGVPARYVTGYVAEERNEAGGFWVARRKHAHAWAEAYDSTARRWLLVESTPADGRPDAGGVSAAQQRREALAFQWQEFRQRMREWRPGQLLHFFASPWVLMGSVVVAALAATSSALSWRPVWRSRDQRSFSEQGDPQLVSERRHMDRFLAAHGWRRRPDETVTSFAERVARGKAEWERLASQWYRRYAHARFGGEQGDAVAQGLRDARRVVIRSHKRHRRPAGQPVVAER